jgi:hypothetical protein
MALVAVARPLPELLPDEKEPPKKGGGYVELGDHVVVCGGFGLAVSLCVTFFVVVLTVRGVVETGADLVVATVAGRVVVDFVVDCDDWISRPKLANCNCSLRFVAGVGGSIPCCFKSNANKAAGFTSVEDGTAVVVVMA